MASMVMDSKRKDSFPPKLALCSGKGELSKGVDQRHELGSCELEINMEGTCAEGEEDGSNGHGQHA